MRRAVEASSDCRIGAEDQRRPAVRREGNTVRNPTVVRLRANRWEEEGRLHDAPVNILLMSFIRNTNFVCLVKTARGHVGG